MRVTAKMIAEELGVSTATVDRVLNNRKGVSEKTIKRVKDKAKELGYKPNTAAKFLSTQKETLVAFVLPIAPEYFWDEIEAEIKTAAEIYADFGFYVQTFRTDAALIENQIHYINNLIDQNLFDALVISPNDADPYIEVINKGILKGIPIFTLNNDVPESKRISFVGGDYYHAGFLAGELIHLFSDKLTDVVIIRESEDMYQMVNKEKGFRDYFLENKSEVKIHPVLINGMNVCLSKAWEKERLQSSDAIYVASGILGEVAEYMKQIQNNKILVGHDMSKKINNFIQKGVISATICQDPTKQAMFTVKNVFEYLLLGEKNETKETIIKLEIVTRANAKYYINY